MMSEYNKKIEKEVEEKIVKKAEVIKKRLVKKKTNEYLNASISPLEKESENVREEEVPKVAQNFVPVKLAPPLFVWC
jgi:hypothetical protein